MANLFDCPKCGNIIDADITECQNAARISYVCPLCKTMIRKHMALRLMDKKDGRKRWSLLNTVEDMKENETKTICNSDGCMKISKQENIGKMSVADINFIDKK